MGPRARHGQTGTDRSIPHGLVDYRLARNAVLSELRKGRLSRLDVCDAHPELLRAAANVGSPASEECPVCEEHELKLVSYVFGARMPPNGKCVSSAAEMAKLRRGGRELACYVVEVCTACSWNHLARSFPLLRQTPAEAGSRRGSASQRART